MDRAGLVEALRTRLEVDGFTMIPGATDQWGSRIFHRREGAELLTVRLEFSSHFYQAMTVSLWMGRTLWPMGDSATRIGGLMTATEQSASGVRDAHDRGDAWWSGYSTDIAQGIADAIAIATPRFMRTPLKHDLEREDELLDNLVAVAARGEAGEQAATDYTAVSPPASWLAAADEWNMSDYRGRIGEKSRLRWARQTAREAWQHRQAGLI